MVGADGAGAREFLFYARDLADDHPWRNHHVTKSGKRIFTDYGNWAIELENSILNGSGRDNSGLSVEFDEALKRFAEFDSSFNIYRGTPTFYMWETTGLLMRILMGEERALIVMEYWLKNGSIQHPHAFVELTERWTELNFYPIDWIVKLLDHRKPMTETQSMPALYQYDLVSEGCSVQRFFALSIENRLPLSIKWKIDT